MSITRKKTIKKYNKKIYNLSKKSYSPNINKKLINKTLKTYHKSQVKSINICNDIFTIKINNKCYTYNDNIVQNLLLKNLKYRKKMNPEKFIAPRQNLSNCWFNTMCVSFFFSDKGIKFFRFFRELMITGKKVDNTKIDTELHKIFFVLNLFIESSYNQNNNTSFIKYFNNYTNNLNTNYFIEKIYNIINKNENKNKLLYSIPKLNDASNPLYYYISIINYLKYDMLKILPIDIYNKYNKKQINDFIYNYLNNHKTIPEIIVLEDLDSKSNHNTEYTFTFNKQTINYKIDSIIITNKDFYEKNSNKHFTSLITCNGIGYKFDGYSYNPLNKFNWIKYLDNNIDKDWTFNENKKYISEKYNITMGYKMLFYYRV